MRGRVSLVFALAGTALGSVSADSVLPALGLAGKGAPFTARCAAEQQVVGFGLRSGDDVNSLWPLCATALGAGRVGQAVAVPTAGGSARGMNVGRLNCTQVRPIVLGVTVVSEVSPGTSGNPAVNAIEIFCGAAGAGQSGRGDYPDARFEAPIFPGGSQKRESQTCPPGLVAVGIHGHAGWWLEKVGLICGTPASLTPPRAPLDVAARAPAKLDAELTPILIEWNTPDQSQSRPVDSYTVERQSPPGPGRPWLVEGSLPGPKGAQAGKTRLAFQFKSAPLDPRRPHAFRVCAVNDAGPTCAVEVLAAVQGRSAAQASATPERAFKAPTKSSGHSRASQEPAFTAPSPPATVRAPAAVAANVAGTGQSAVIGAPSIVEPRAGSTHAPQTAMKIRVAPPGGSAVTSYELQFQRRNPAGAWVFVTSVPVGAAAIEGVGYTGWGGHAPGTPGQMTAVAGEWRVRARAMVPVQAEPGAWIAFAVAGAPGASPEQRVMDRVRTPSAAEMPVRTWSNAATTAPSSLRPKQ